MIGSILVVCIGNICRSPLGEALLRESLPKISIQSAGLGALVGHGADELAAATAFRHGVDLSKHRAQQLTTELGIQSDLILVMEPGHKKILASIAPQVLGKTMLFDHWSGGHGIEDPYKRSAACHEATFEKSKVSALAWANKLGERGSN